MSLSPDISIWIIEDDYRDTVEYYLEPLERIASELSKTQPGFAFPSVKVLLLGLDPNQEHDYQRLKTDVREQRAYPFTRPHLHSNPNYETSVDEFMDFLRGQLRDGDVVLVDPSARGSQWWPEDGRDDLGKALYFIYENIHSWRNERDRERILLVSHDSKLSYGAMTKYRKTADARLPKLKVDASGYREALRSRLERFLMSPADWVESLNPEGNRLLAPYVERLRRTPEGRAALRNVGLCAAMSVLQIITPDRNCAKDLVEATGDKPRYYYDPLIPKKLITPANLYDPELFRVLIRRRALYGLRKLWQAFSPKRDDEAEYKLWLEVVAAGYRWYFDESGAIEGIYGLMRDGRLTLGPQNSIDLRDCGLSYTVKNSEVITAHLSAGPDKLRYQAGGERFVRFFQGNVSFIVKGQRFRASGQQDRAKSYFEVRYRNWDRAQLPANNSAPAAWDAFWAKTEFLKDFDQIRHGHVEKMQKQLIHRCYFKDVNAMVLFERPMPEEEEWWRDNRNVFEGKLQVLAKLHRGFLAFDPGHQSDKNWCS